jgi:hypothetical protein
MENIWSEIRSGFEDEGILYIDAWVSPDDNEEGKVIATIDLETGVVSYRDDRAKTDKYAQEMISLVLQNITPDQDIPEDNICTDGLNIGKMLDMINAPENFSTCEVKEFIDKHGKSMFDEIPCITGHDLDDYFYEPGSTKWIMITSPEYSKREQAIANYLYIKTIS